MDKTSTLPQEPTFLGQFKSHPESVGETYWSHLFFAFRFGLTMIGMGFCAIIHGLVPPLFVTTGSDFIKKTHAKLIARQG